MRNAKTTKACLVSVWLMIGGGAYGATRVIYIDPINSDAPTNGWNDLNFALLNSTATLVDSQTNSTGIRTQVTAAIQAANSNGSTAPTGAAAEFAPAGGNSAYGNALSFSAGVYPYGEVVFSNLSVNVAYHFTFYASRIGAGGDNREALYTVTGANSGSNTLNASENSSQAVAVSNVYPRANGTITFRFEKGPNNNNAYGFFYLSAMKIAYTEVPTVVYVDACGTSTSPGWNLLTFNDYSDTLLTATNGEATGYRIQVISPLNGVNGNASASPTNAAAEFAPAGIDNCFGNNAAWGPLVTQGVARVYFLSTNVAYTFTFYASRMGAADNREARYTVTGTNSAYADLNAANNDYQVAMVSNIYPAADGTVTVEVKKGANNNNGSEFFYINAFKISYIKGLSPYMPPAIAGKRLLFLGNNYLGNENVPNLVSLLAGLGGYKTPLVASELADGQTLAYHIGRVNQYPGQNANHISLTGTNTWDYVILQGTGDEATHVGDVAGFRTNALALYQKIKYHATGKGSNSVAVLFEPWARGLGHSYYPGTFASAAAMQQEISNNTQIAAAAVASAEGVSSVRIAAAGDAFQRGAFSPSVLYSGDLNNAGSAGPELAAMVLYKAIYNTTVTNLSYTSAIYAGFTNMRELDWLRTTAWAEGLAAPPDPQPPSAQSPEVVLIDTAANADPAAYVGWNYLSFDYTNKVSTLVLSNGYQTAMSCEVLARLNGVNGNGSPTPAGGAAIFAPARGNGAYGTTTTNFNSLSTPVGLARFSGMNKLRPYTFTIYASRMDVADNRDTVYTVTGANSGSASLDPVNNNSKVITFTGIRPTADGTIDLQITAGPNNNNVYGFFGYIAGIKVESQHSGLAILVN